MNIILLDPKYTLGNERYGLTQRQQTHISNVIKAKQGDILRVGILNGKIGEGFMSHQAKIRLATFIRYLFLCSRQSLFLWCW